jgi:hypothetical protein
LLVVTVTASFAVAGIALAASAGSTSEQFTGTFTGTATYTFLGGKGIQSVKLTGMTNPVITANFNSLQNAQWTLTETSNCVKYTLVQGSGYGGASVQARKPPFNVPGRKIQVGGKVMGPGNFLQACVS